MQKKKKKEKEIEKYSEVLKHEVKQSGAVREMPWKVLECQKSKATFQKQKQQGFGQVWRILVRVQKHVFTVNTRNDEKIKSLKYQDSQIHRSK